VLFPSVREVSRTVRLRLVIYNAKSIQFRTVGLRASNLSFNKGRIKESIRLLFIAEPRSRSAGTRGATCPLV
jgi:hypothetical protein